MSGNGYAGKLARLFLSAGIAGACLFSAALTAWAAVTAGDLELEGDADYSFEDGVLTIHGGSLSVRGTDDESAVRIVIDGDAELTLAGVNIQSPSGGAPITVAPGAEAVISLMDGTVNTLQGADGYAGLEAGYSHDGETTVLAGVTITGGGTLNAYGGSNSAGIGGSYIRKGDDSSVLYGNITIESGTVNASSASQGAGIGSAANWLLSDSSFKVDGDTWGTITINGGTVNAVGGGGNGGAGIGGGNHVDSGKIVINGGSVTARGNGGAAGIGSGLGSSKAKSDDNNNKGAGYYFADVEINGGTVNAYGSGNGAGIGGGMYCDAYVEITGGTVTAEGGAGSDNYHHGGAGIGGGYEGHGAVTVTGGNVTAAGATAAAGIGSGGSPNSNPDRGVNGRGEAAVLSGTSVTISGGTVTASGGSKGGAGIGGGVGTDKVSVSVSGGTVSAYGAASSEDAKEGGAGIGSGYSGLTSSDSAKYFVQTETTISVTGGTILAVGGWGASGIGSGSDGLDADDSTKQPMADITELDSGAASIEAYADGTKFAVDTRVLDGDGYTASHSPDSVSGNILQGTFVHAGQIGDYDQDPEGLRSIIITNDKTDVSKELTNMPDGYRSFATDVSSSGVYTVYTDAESIGRGEGRFFSVCYKDIYDENEIKRDEDGNKASVQYTVSTGALSDNFYLFPVKSVVVTKVVSMDDALKEGFDQDFYFALWVNAEGKYEPDPDDASSIWVEKVPVRDGVPQRKAYFTDVRDKTYGVWEMKEADGGWTEMDFGHKFGSVTLKRIETRQSHKEGSQTENDATITDDVWTDYVDVINTLEGTSTGVLTITKQLSGTGSSREDTFTFRITLGDALSGAYPAARSVESGEEYTKISDSEAVVFADGTAEIALNGGESLSITGLPDGTAFSVEETGDAGYESTISFGAEGTISRAAESYVRFLNRKDDESTVDAVKEWENENGDTSNRPESISVDLYRVLRDRESGEEVRDEEPFDTASLSEKNQWHHTWTGLPTVISDDEIDTEALLASSSDAYNTYAEQNSKTEAASASNARWSASYAKASASDATPSDAEELFDGDYLLDGAVLNDLTDTIEEEAEGDTGRLFGKDDRYEIAWVVEEQGVEHYTSEVTEEDTGVWKIVNTYDPPDPPDPPEPDPPEPDPPQPDPPRPDPPQPDPPQPDPPRPSPGGGGGGGGSSRIVYQTPPVTVTETEEEPSAEGIPSVTPMIAGLPRTGEPAGERPMRRAAKVLALFALLILGAGAFLSRRPGKEART